MLAKWSLCLRNVDLRLAVVRGAEEVVGFAVVGVGVGHEVVDVVGLVDGGADELEDCEVDTTELELATEDEDTAAELEVETTEDEEMTELELGAADDEEEIDAELDELVTGRVDDEVAADDELGTTEELVIEELVVTTAELLLEPRIWLVYEWGEYISNLLDALGVGVGTELEDEEDPPSQGSEDSKSSATYRFRVLRPPQVSVASPLQGELHLASATGRVPFPRTTPQ